MKNTNIPFTVIGVNKDGSTAWRKENIPYDELRKIVPMYGIPEIDWCGVEDKKGIYNNLAYFSIK